MEYHIFFLMTYTYHNFYLYFSSCVGEFSSLNLGKLNHQAALTDDIDFIARSYWLEVLLFLHCGDREASVRALQQVFVTTKLIKNTWDR